MTPVPETWSTRRDSRDESTVYTLSRDPQLVVDDDAGHEVNWVDGTDILQYNTSIPRWALDTCMALKCSPLVIVRVFYSS